METRALQRSFRRRLWRSRRRQKNCGEQQELFRGERIHRPGEGEVFFGETAGVTGVALTKLDGSARGGVAIAIAVELGLPVKLVGVGEGVEDLRPFDAGDYARALISP